ncbi:MAG: AMP-binding protein [Candidatus Calescibacterium sp.]|nr:AMP-binding protein [Candidatus Calescibacterium sp.]MDW8133263.1 AMP-binding protein [Candidatus Calescibacterium sp.]
MKKLFDFVESSASKFANKTAIIYKDQRWTFGELKDIVLSIARGLLFRTKIEPQDRVVLMLPNIPHFAFFYYAVNLLGGVVVPLNPLLKENEISYILSNCNPKLVVTMKSDFDMFFKIMNRGIIIVDEDRDDLPDGVWNLRQVIINEGNINTFDSDPAVLMYTSGTTGFPKGAMLSNNNIISNVIGVEQVLDLSISDVFVAVLPLFHSFGQTSCLNLPFYLGCGVVFVDRFMPQGFIDVIVKNEVTLLPAVPSIYSALLQYPLNFEHKLRYSVSGGAPLAENIELEFEKRFGCKILQGYGLTECSPIVSVNPPFDDRTGSVGKPLPNVSVRVLTDDGHISENGIGELLVSGPNVMMGYYGMDSKDFFVDGYFCTGDIVKIDNEGYLYILDRKKDLIIVGGLNVYPSEVEKVILGYPGVLECAVVGKKDRERGEVPVAFVVTKEEIDIRDLMSFLRKNLASYKVPKEIVFKDQLPKSNTGKVLKKNLQMELV